MRVLAVGVLVLSTGAFFAVSDEALADTSHPAVLPLWSLTYALAAAALLDGVVRLRLRLPLPVGVLAFVALAACSVTWSVDPALTARRSVGLLGTVLVGLLLAQRLRPLEVLEALRRAMLVVAVASLLLWASGDPAALDEIHGTLRGVLATKNSLGRAMAVGVIASAVTVALDRRQALRCGVSSAVMALALALTQSTGAVLLAVSVPAVLLVLALHRSPRGRIGIAALVWVAVAVAVVSWPVLDLERLTGLIGEDATLTGRDEIWSQSWDALRSAWVLGYGYGAFWVSSERADAIRSRLFWEVPNGHNGLLDVALDVGVVGAVLVAAVLVGLVVRGIRDGLRGDVAISTLRLAVALVVLVSTAAESGLFVQNSLLTILLVVATAAPAPPASPPVASPAPARRPSAVAG